MSERHLSSHHFVRGQRCHIQSCSRFYFQVKDTYISLSVTQKPYSTWPTEPIPTGQDEVRSVPNQKILAPRLIPIIWVTRTCLTYTIVEFRTHIPISTYTLTCRKPSTQDTRSLRQKKSEDRLSKLILNIDIPVRCTFSS